MSKQDKPSCKKEKREYKILPSLVLIVVGIFIITAVSAWTVPTAAPPGGNVSTPINVGATAQTKSGDLTTNGYFYESGTRMQKRVSGSCAAGSSIRVIDSNGNVTCEPDTDTDTNTWRPAYTWSCVDAVAAGGMGVQVNCPGGRIVTGGGCNCGFGALRDTNTSGNGWYCECTGATWAYARCCSLNN